MLRLNVLVAGMLGAMDLGALAASPLSRLSRIPDMPNIRDDRPRWRGKNRGHHGRCEGCLGTHSRDGVYRRRSCMFFMQMAFTRRVR